MDAGRNWVRALLGAMVIAAMPVMGSNLGFLRDTPFSYFTDEDINLFMTNVSQTLSQAQDNEVRTWSNPQTQSSGQIVPLNTQPQPDGVCRDVSIVNTARGHTNKGIYTFCRRQGGEWKMSTRKPK